ncbi:caspase family protein [Chryseolinea lacunae]|uniref:Caspase family protein n=1 Tax=Chryseolinea lacunae TaxID=2801331 RepID=A0ABS1KSC7_9BACT|nr:caspase family protein [Chryseolinea lacunae]MBL0742331.1 caspase family protein [Chryseolinea lacunae]
MKRVVFILLLSPFYSLCQSLETIIQKGHELAVIAVAVSADSNFVATGSRDKSAKLWEMSTGREVRSFLGHEASVTSLEFTRDGKYLLTGSNDKTARLWDVATGREIFSVASEDIVTDVALDPKMKFFIVAGYANTATVFDYDTRKVLADIEINSEKGVGGGIDISISPDGKFITLGEDNHIAHIYQTSDWKKIHSITYEEGWCGGCGARTEFGRDGKSLYLASNNGPLRKYELPSFNLIKSYEKKSNDLKGLAISPDGKRVARSTERDVLIYDEKTGALLDSISAEGLGEFHELAFTLDSKRLLISCDNNTSLVWNLASKKADKPLTGFLNERDRGGLTYDPNFYWQSNIAKFVRFKNAVLITRDGKNLIKGKFGTKVKRWDIATGKTLMEYVGHKKAVLCYELSKDGRRMLTGGGDGKIMLWDVETGDSLKSINTYREPIFDIHFSSDETTVASSSWDGTMKVHDLNTGKLITYVDLDNASTYSLVYHPNDLYLFTARLNNTLQMWELDTKKEVRNFVGHTDVISFIQLSLDQKTLLSASWDGSVRLWDVGTGLMTKKFKGHHGAVHTAMFGLDGKTIYSAGADRTIRVWDMNSATVVRTFEGHKAEVTSLAFSADQKMLISHSLDGVTKFWDMSSGKEFLEHIHLGEKDWMVKNPEGYFNSTGEARRYIHFASGMKTYAVDQFFNEFYRPDLLPRIFQNRGGKEDSKGIQGKLKSSPPPTVKIAIIPGLPGKAEVYVRIIDNGNGVENLKLFHNGKNIPLDRDALTFPASRGQATTYKHDVDLIGGPNTFMATASNKDNIESDPQTAELFSDHATKSSTCYVLAVGINEYKNSKLNLNYARPDAESFGKLMDAKSTLFKNIELTTLYDTDATRPKILAALENLSKKVSQEDVFIFYYAGHGSMVDNHFYFIPTENLRLYDASSLTKEAIEAGVLQDKFKQIKALKQLIVMDACQSGGSVELLATRGASEEKAIAQLSRSAGIHVMASAGSEQFATEFRELGHGLFTYVLIKGLQGEADGAPKDGKVTIYELKSYIDDQVPEMTRKLKGNPQYPYTFSRGQDFPVVIEK